MDALPSLNPLLKLQPSTSQFDGQSQWTLYHPIANQFYKIGWAEYECLSRLHKYKNGHDLIKAVNDETALDIDESDLEDVLKFLAMNGLLEGKSQQNMAGEGKSLWNKIAHGYLYFTFPILKPEKFLRRTSGFIKPLLSKPFHYAMMILLAVGVLMTLPRIDEFFGSFTQIFTLEGVILTAVIMTGIKIIHEFAHGYVATINGVPVPHMGVAFIVLYPIFYTEATGAWRLTDRRARMAIGLAGVRFEVYLAAFSMIAWHFVTPGLPQMMCFTIVAISFLGSLLINLNPLMRFDGYYVLSDYLNIENLHGVALDYARNHLRGLVLGLNDSKPHDYPVDTARTLMMFGYAILIYRFFLFLGIAVLVYAVFMKPLGLIAMILELAWFIAMPIWREFKIWWERRADFMGSRRFYISGAVALGALALLILPIHATYHYPAVIHARDYQVAYAPVPAEIRDINVKNGQEVSEGDLLISMSSPLLDKGLKQAEAKLRAQQQMKRRDQTNIELYRERRGGIDIDIETAQTELNNLRAQKDDLNITAKFDGIVFDMQDHLRVGYHIQSNDPLFRLIKPNDVIVSVYIPEKEIKQFNVNNKVEFRPSYKLTGGLSGIVEKIETSSLETIHHEGLSSIYNGEIPSQKTEEGDLKPLNTLNKMTVIMDGEIPTQTIIHGHVIIDGRSRSVLWDIIPQWFTTARNELSLN